MNIRELKPPREFVVGIDQNITLRHCAEVELAPDEQVTFVSAGGTEYDVVRKEWGYYATPSLNKRLPSKGLRAVLVRTQTDKAHLLLVERGREAEFRSYLEAEGTEIICWLDDDQAVSRVRSSLAGQGEGAGEGEN